jgi:predicted Rossmann fold flavoprotein
MARQFGHTIVDPRPALVPIRVEPSWVPELRGIALPDVVAKIIDETGKSLLERREAVLFAHFGLSGPVILDISRAVTRDERPERLAVSLDFLPEQRHETLDLQFQTECRSGRPSVVGLLPSLLPRRLAEAILFESSIPIDRRGPDLTRDERRRLVANLKGLRLPVAGTLGFAKAEVTSGGVALDEVDPETMASRLQRGLYFCGEILNLDGLIGGYNFQGAWSTGWLAGSQV